MKILIFFLFLTGCTIRFLDDTQEYDITARVVANEHECTVDIIRNESKAGSTKTVEKRTP